MSLMDEINEHAKSVVTTSYSMSISELLAMYREKEITIRPEYQRLFRWDPEQKSKFIESLLLDIPTPGVFVSENEDSRWEIIDGLQRISTILEVAGVLLDNDGNTRPPLRLMKTQYLPDLEGMTWEGSDSDKIIPDTVKIRLKRARIDVTILRKTSDLLAKYEIFQRLNTGGSKATEQEVRNCVVLMFNKKFFDFIHRLSTLESFRNCFAFSDNQIDEAFDQELVTRFVVFTQTPIEDMAAITELGTYLTDKVTRYAQDNSFDYNKANDTFAKTFDILQSSLGDDSFRKYDTKKCRYYGQSLVSLFEIIAIGIGSNLFNGKNVSNKEYIKKRHVFIWDDVQKSISGNIGSGVRASTRIPKTIGFGIDWAREHEG